MRQGPVSRQDICQAFFISTRRALEVMRYLVKFTHNVECERFPPAPGEKERGYRIHVHAIFRPEAPCGKQQATARSIPAGAADNDAVPAPHVSKEPGPRRVKTRGEHKYQELRRWFLQRPPINNNDR